MIMQITMPRITSRSHPEWGELQILEINGEAALIRRWVNGWCAQETEVEVSDLEGDVAGYREILLFLEAEETNPAGLDAPLHLFSRFCRFHREPIRCQECRQITDGFWQFECTNKGTRKMCGRCKEEAIRDSFIPRESPERGE